MTKKKSGSVGADAFHAHLHDFTKEEPWRIFRIMAEFVDSFETMSSQGPLVTVFGSARTKPEEHFYQDAEKFGRLLVENGYGALTGGGPGIMEAVNKGAYEANGASVGLNIILPMEQSPNPYQTTGIDYRYFFIRKVCFLKYALAVVGYPGGFGTMDEFFEAMTLIQTHKVNAVPIVLVGKKFWTPMVEWLKNTLIEDGMISPEDMDLFRVVDSADEAMAHILECHKAGIIQTTTEF